MPIRIDFLSHRHTFWHSLASLMLECRSRETFVPRCVLGDGQDSAIASRDLEIQWMEAHNIPWVSLDDYSPEAGDSEVIVFTTPYAHTRLEKLQPYILMSKGIHPVLIPYCTEWMGGQTFADSYFAINPLFWRTFTASSLSSKMYQDLQNIPASRVPVTGNPEYDVMQWTDLPKLEHIREMAAGRKILLWTPHYDANNYFRWCTWEFLAEGIVRILSRYADDVFVVLRPHHFLREKMVPPAPGVEAQDVFERIARQIADADNFWIDDSGQCLESVMACDGLISDCSSLVAKAMRLGKSVLYTCREDSDGAQHLTSILEGHVHITTSVAGVQRFVETVLRGDDPLLPLPEQIKEFMCGKVDGKAAVRIADHLERYFITMQEPA